MSSDDQCPTSFDERLRRVEDRLELLQLIAGYGPAVDSGSSAATAEIWTTNGSYDVYPEVLIGRAEIANMVEGELHQSLIGRGCAHLTGLPFIEIDGDDAVVTTYSQLILRDSDADQYRIWRTGVNRWICIRTGEGWRVSHRTNRQLDGGEEARRLLAAALPADPG